MAEGFQVDEHWVSGYGLLLEDERDVMKTIVSHTGYWGSSDDYTGVMAPLVKPVDEFAKTSYNLLNNLQKIISQTSTEMQRTAWVYLEKEDENVKLLSDDSHDVEPDEKAHSYAASSAAVDPPTTEIDFGELFDEFGSNLKEIDALLADILGWKVHRKIIVSISGDWTALTRSGESMKNCGDAAEEIAESLKSNLTDLDRHWDGDAAQRCTKVITKIYEELEDVAALSRTIGRLYTALADQVKEVAGAIVGTLDDTVKKLLNKKNTDWISQLLAQGGCDVWYEEDYKEAKKIIRDNSDLFESAKTLINNVESLVDDMISVIKNVDEFDKISDTIKDIETIEKDTTEAGKLVNHTTESIAISKDIEEMSDPSGILNAPEEGFELGKDPKRDGK